MPRSPLARLDFIAFTTVLAILAFIAAFTLLTNGEYANFPLKTNTRTPQERPAAEQHQPPTSPHPITRTSHRRQQNKGDRPC